LAEEALLEKQVTYLYHASAKKLYNLALYSIGYQPLAEQLSIGAFTSAYNRLPDKSDVTRFQIKSARHLYLISKKLLIRRIWHRAPEPDPLESLEPANDTGKSQIQQLLCGLNYDERFLLLLLLQQKFSQKQIVQILCIPKFIIKKRIFKMLKKAMIYGPR
jgi:DNA-directed RNA polymerase specialized sigma24 family protein